MTKRYLLLYIVLSWGWPASGQNTDSTLLLLQQKLPGLTDREDLAEVHGEIAMLYYKGNDFIAAKASFLQQISFLDSTRQTKEWSIALRDLGDVQQRRGDYAGALKTYRRAEPYFRVEGGANELALLYGKIGLTHSQIGEFGKAMDLYEESLSLYENAGKVDSTGLADIYLSIGILHSRKGNYLEAVTFNQKAEEWYLQLNNTSRLLFVYNNLSGNFLSQGHSSRALEYLQKTLLISEQLDSKVGLATASNNIGMVYLSQEEYEKALPYFEKCKALATEMGDRSLLGQVNSNLGNSYQNLGNQEKASEYLGESLRIRTEIGDQQGIARANHSLGSLYRKDGKFDLSKKHLHEAREISEKLGEQMGMAKAYQALGYLALDQRRYQDAVKWCEKGAKIAFHIEAPDAIEENCLCLSRAYEKTGDYRNALLYHKQYQEARDSIINETQTQELTRLELRYEFDREKEIMVLEQDQKEAVMTEQLARQQLVGFGMLGGIIAGLAILGLLWRGYRQKQKANALLESQKATVQRALEDRENLLREIHHRVKNNLQVVSSLLSLQSRTIKDPTALDAIQEGRNRVRAMGLIHQNLYQEENLVGVDLPQYIEKLTDSLVSSYKVDTGSIRIEREIAPIPLDVDTLIPLGLILNELISNALKYAFQGRDEGKIEVKIREKDASLEILVRDNGVGMPPGFRLEKTDTMGYKLVRAFADKMKAKVEMERGEGTSVRIVVEASGDPITR